MCFIDVVSLISLYQSKPRNEGSTMLRTFLGSHSRRGIELNSEQMWVCSLPAPWISSCCRERSAAQTFTLAQQTLGQTRRPSPLSRELGVFCHSPHHSLVAWMLRLGVGGHLSLGLCCFSWCTETALYSPVPVTRGRMRERLEVCEFHLSRGVASLYGSKDYFILLTMQVCAWPA